MRPHDEDSLAAYLTVMAGSVRATDPPPRSRRQGHGTIREDPRSTSTPGPGPHTAHEGRIRSYVSRHVEEGLVEAVVDAVLVVAWERGDDLPEDLVAWLLIVARHTIATLEDDPVDPRPQGFDRARLSRLAVPTALRGLDPSERERVVAAIGALPPRRRESVLLVVWDGLDTASAATVLGLGQVAFSLVLSRARRQLRRELTEGQLRVIDGSVSPSPPSAVSWLLTS